MAIALGPGEYTGYQPTGGKQKHSGPCGRRKTRPYNVYRKAIAERGNEYWKRIGRAYHDVNHAVRLVYWT